MEWLSEEEQYKLILSYDQIMRIKDPKLRELRINFCLERRKIFEDEIKYPDNILDSAIDEIDRQEEKALKLYKCLSE